MNHARVVGTPLPVVLIAALAWVISGTVPLHARQAVAAPPAAAQPTTVAPALSDAEMERFLKQAKIVRTRGTGKGVTDSTRATLSDGTLTHDAHIQVIDDYKREFRSASGVEFDFRDSWSFNVAAYKLDRLIGLQLVPVSVQRSYRSTPAAVTWWVDDVLMDEGERMKRKAEAPPARAVAYRQQMSMLRLFDQLIYNIDRNLGNLLIARDWQVWAIDHTRAFRKHTELKSPAYVSRCDRLVFERLKALDLAGLKQALKPYLDDGQIKAMLARRDAIVANLEKLGSAALFDRAAVAQPQ